MSSLGQLVAGVAHEINNPISFIYGNINYVEAYFQKLLDLVSHYQNHYPNPASTITKAIAALDLDYLKNDLSKLLGSMKRGTERIRKIGLSLRNFARMDESEYKAVNLHDGIESTLMILENRLKAQAHRPAIEIVRDYEDLPLVECYAGYLNQVFMNLLNNAIDALEEANQNKNFKDLEEHPNVIEIHTTIDDRDRVKITIARQRNRHSRKIAIVPLRSILYHQACWCRYRLRAFHQLPNHHRKAQWQALLSFNSGRKHKVFH